MFQFKVFKFFKVFNKPNERFIANDVNPFLIGVDKFRNISLRPRPMVCSGKNICFGRIRLKTYNYRYILDIPSLTQHQHRNNRIYFGLFLSTFLAKSLAKSKSFFETSPACLYESPIIYHHQITRDIFFVKNHQPHLPQ